MSLFSSTDVGRIHDFYREEESTRSACGRRMCTGLTLIAIVLLSFLPAAILLVPLIYLFFSLSLDKSVAGAILYGLLFLQPLGVAITIASKRYSASLLPLDNELLHRFYHPPIHMAPIFHFASGGCWLVNGCSHSHESSPAIFYIISGSCCGSDRLLSSRQLWTLIALEAWFFAGCLTAFSGPFCMVFPDGADLGVLIIFACFLPPFGWYYLLKRLFARLWPEHPVLYDSTRQVFPDEQEEGPRLEIS